ncbi:tautomerase family protein [Azospirillum agricola]|uniref:tautomerase family protein n=1 Tax=Azospirillum agricola TaxID=1720247 RepID=UPI000A0EFEA2|nr:tautomerase family protein [Azospirillum agricola]MBP2227927.1 4-oxalocrotonate tautomerase [Azospirillum agricola]SMH46332.1 4-oxalocrotonate tautomerase [Azospirillum lipoferum]
MPIIDVTILAGRPPEKRLALIQALTRAAVESFDVPPEGVRVLLREIPPEHFAVAGTPKKPLVPG